MIKKISFIVLVIAFFIVPALIESSREYAPGLAVLAGIIFSVCFGNPYINYTSKITSKLLGATIVGMGCGMNLSAVIRAGGNGFLYTLIGIILGIGLGYLLGKLLKVSKNSAYLVSVGTSICGGSAIAAAAPALKAQAHDVAIASVTVFTLNAVALWIFPIIGRALDFNQVEFGYFAALGIHDTSSVVGATMTFGEEALEVGTTVKLARALWIVPVTIFLSVFVAGRSEDDNKKIKIKIPWFIPWFIIAAAVVTYLPKLIPAAAEEIAYSGAFLKNISKYLMITTLFMIGANLSREKIKELGIKPILLGIILWLILGTLWCAAIHFNWINCVK
ncbi:MAG: putative sulfate exporter family transporter [Lentisphaeria bacterium]|nr:putative sulfate exporter family transporter [Lentisphaeria bacterium]